MKKRGMIEVHFNWIFVLIAGAIIFVFFISIVNKQREFSEIKTSGTIITSLESILTGAQVSTRTVNEIDMPKIDIGFECDRYFIGPVPKQTKGNVIFSPNLIKGKKMITWALDWSMPYRVTNFLYVTDPQVRYIIVNNSENLGKKIYDELPKEMNKELIDASKIGNVTDKNNYKVKFVFLNNVVIDDPNNNGLKNLGKMPDQDVTSINLIGLETSSLIPATCTIKFFRKKEQIGGAVWKEQKQDGKAETYYLKKESLFGAIFAENLGMYNCAMRKAFKKLNLVTKIYLNRSSTLAEYYGIDNMGCTNEHSGAIQQLNNIMQYSEAQYKDFPASLVQIDDIETSAYHTEIGVWAHNRNAQLYSCALIY